MQKDVVLLLHQRKILGDEKQLKIKKTFLVGQKNFGIHSRLNTTSHLRKKNESLFKTLRL